MYDPANTALSLDEAQEMTELEITSYLKEHPPIFCYAIKPEVSGNYLVQIQNADSISNTSKRGATRTARRGIYTNFKFLDSEGNLAASLNIRDIIELREIFLEANPTYLEEIY